MYQIVCEVIPAPLAYVEDFADAKKVAEVKAEEVWHEQGSSQYCMVKDLEFNTVYAVRYTPENGGTYYTPVEHFLYASAMGV